MMAAPEPLLVALAGNPNAGKTTLFNALTGARGHVANYPGVTVELREGECRRGGVSMTVVDLPGTYSLTAASLEERLARDFLIDRRPDVVLQVVDVTSLERGLYLALQVLELGRPTIVVLTMMDMGRRLGLDVDQGVLAELLGVSVASVVCSRDEGVDELVDLVGQVAAGLRPQPGLRLRYGRDVDEAVADLVERIRSGGGDVSAAPPPAWLAVKLLEGDPGARDRVESCVGDAAEEVVAAARAAANRLEALYGDPAEILLADRRYGFISGACVEAVRTTVERRHEVTDRIDDVVTHRLLGIPIFLGVMYLVFWLTFTLGDVPSGWLGQGVAATGAWLDGFWPKGSESPVRALLVEGVVGGVGGVLVFLPNIVFLFLGLSVLEDTGYMARAAFLTDWLMHKIGLHGRSFIPMVVGFGCTVPGILATRTLESRRDRLTTMLVLPLMSCSARFPIYALVIPAFFPHRWQAPVLWGVYLTGIGLAVALARLLRSTLLAGDSVPFVMELPLYRLPTVRGTLVHVGERVWLYVKKAGTVILGASVILWAMGRYPDHPEARVRAASELAKVEERFSVAGEALAASLPGLAEVLRSERAVAVLGLTHHPREAVFLEAVARRDATVAARAPGSPARLFVEFRDELRRARRQADELRRRLTEEGRSGEGEALGRAAQASAFEALRRRAPDVAELARRFLDEVEGPREEAVDAVGRRLQGELLDHSVAGRVGSMVEPLLLPAGLDRRIGTALIGAFAAKELFVAQLGIVAAVSSAHEGVGDLRDWLSRRYRPLQGLCILVFCLVGAPCMATVAATGRESGRWRWAILQLGGLTLLAWILCVLLYQTGSLMGL